MSLPFTDNPNLPSNEYIVELCVRLGLPRGTTILDPSTGAILAWVKCGHNVDLDEARTQHWTAMALREAGISHVHTAPIVYRAFAANHFNIPIGYIVMEYFEGTDCDDNDVDLVARAVETLISLRAPPSATLGHIDGGTVSIVHPFFPEWLPNASYRCDKDFYDHIHGVGGPSEDSVRPCHCQLTPPL
ncbi:hypothetical protein ONZ45_g15723 [Pleurotus djamor]|nr:hypothetical protein ONZ45_g15723 [Pleurotus djamor]